MTCRISPNTIWPLPHAQHVTPRSWGRREAVDEVPIRTPPQPASRSAHRELEDGIEGVAAVRILHLLLLEELEGPPRHLYPLHTLRAK